MSNIYKGRCPENLTAHLLDVLNDVFFSEDPNTNFLDLLPKLYKDKYNPAYNNLIIAEDGVIKAAIGCFPSKACVAGRELNILGIGNVAVAKDSRSKGYMIELMNDSIEIMKNDNYDYSLLGGQRQRYGFFGYDPIGSEYRFLIDKGNIRRILGGERKSRFTARKVTAEDTVILGKIKELYDSLPFRIERKEEDMSDILRSWKNIPYAVFEGEEFKGYFCVLPDNNRHIAEARTTNIEDMLELFMCVLETKNIEGVSLNVPLFDTELCDFMAKNCGGLSIGTPEMINIFNFGRFTEAFLALKATRMKLCEGELTLLIHGMKRDERITIKVDGENNVTVFETEKEADIELSHREAINFIGGLFSKERNEMKADYAQSWFPVDFYSYSLDNV